MVIFDNMILFLFLFCVLSLLVYKQPGQTMLMPVPSSMLELVH